MPMHALKIFAATLALALPFRLVAGRTNPLVWTDPKPAMVTAARPKAVKPKQPAAAARRPSKTAAMAKRRPAARHASLRRGGLLRLRDTSAESYLAHTPVPNKKSK